MEYEKIKELINDMGDSKLTSIDIDFPDGTKIKMRKEEKIIENIIDNRNVNYKMDKENNIETISENKEEEKEIEGKIIKSPMVGTFYKKPSPDSKPYVEEGTNVKKGDILCIIEAMKLMNEIEAEEDGKILEVLIEDGTTVEYGTPLFRIGE